MCVLSGEKGDFCFKIRKNATRNVSKRGRINKLAIKLYGHENEWLANPFPCQNSIKNSADTNPISVEPVSPRKILGVNKLYLKNANKLPTKDTDIKT